jgi:hypothetical protein
MGEDRQTNDRAAENTAVASVAAVDGPREGRRHGETRDGARRAHPGSLATHSHAYAVWSWIGIALFSLSGALIGTLLHRAGADRSIPWGLVLALLLVFACACWARHAHGVIGVAVNLLLSSTLIWIVSSSYGPGGDILVPISSTAFVTFWSQNAGYIWILGATLVQLLVLVLPRRWFADPSSSSRASSAERDGFAAKSSSPSVTRYDSLR